MDFSVPAEREAIREAVRDLCSQYPDPYWRRLDETSAYPTEFIDALTEAGFLSAMIPELYGGAGLGIADGSVILEEINHCGANAAAAHAQMYTMGTLLRHGSDALKATYLPQIASGRLRLQAFGVTEPNAGSETTRISTFAARTDTDTYKINGQKVFISRAEHSDLMLLLARTTPYDELDDKTRGLSVFLVDLQSGLAEGTIEIRPISVMVNHHTTEVTFRECRVPAQNLVGTEGEGFRHIIDGWNAERILVASEAIGDGRWFTERASSYGSQRRVFGRPIGANQGIQFPVAQAYANVMAAALVRDKAAWLFDQHMRCGPEANMAKLLASQASWAAANACMDTHGGYGFAREFDVERKFRETRLLTVAPVGSNMVLSYLGHNVLHMPRSY